MHRQDNSRQSARSRRTATHSQRNLIVHTNLPPAATSLPLTLPGEPRYVSRIKLPSIREHWSALRPVAVIENRSATTACTSRYRLKATAALSNAAPRFAEVAGNRSRNAESTERSTGDESKAKPTCSEFHSAPSTPPEEWPQPRPHPGAEQQFPARSQPSPLPAKAFRDESLWCNRHP